MSTITLKEWGEIDNLNGWFKGIKRSQSFESTRRIVPSVNLSIKTEDESFESLLNGFCDET